jgi:membrane protein implicated in regulation of membrane protease activity
MKFFFAFIAERGFSLMLGGFMITVAGIVAYATINTPRFAGTPYPTAAIVFTFIGLAVYIIGRVSVSVQRRRTYERGRGRAADDDDKL